MKLKHPVANYSITDRLGDRKSLLKSPHPITRVFLTRIHSDGVRSFAVIQLAMAMDGRLREAYQRWVSP